MQIANVLLSRGISSTLAHQLEKAISDGQFDKETLKSAINFALSEKLAALQSAYVGVIILGAAISAVSYLLSGFTRATIWVGLIVAGAIGAENISRQRRQLKGVRSDFQTVQRCEIKQSSPDTPFSY